MMKLNFTYNVSPRRLLHDKTVSGSLDKMRRAGVKTIYLFGYFYGSFESEPEHIAKAKKVLEDEGFATGIINVPLGHGGNALDPTDPNVNLDIGNGWRMTMDSMGRYRLNTTCIDEVMMEDSKKANLIMYEMGFRSFFNDDDLRLGQWGPELQGCFCNYCMDEFYSIVGRKVTREDIVSMKDSELCEAWMSYQCEKIARFLLVTTPKGARNGIMVMHNGDRRHGIDIPLLRKLMPDNLVFRVGEAHFDDNAFANKEGYESVERSIRRHMALVGDHSICYSETTCYPKNALSPENWIEKMKLEIRCGLRNLYLMSGTWFFEDSYWDALEKALPELVYLADTTEIPELILTEFSWVW
jgi:hypothetical protein